MPILVDAKFTLDGIPVDLNNSFSSADISIPSANASIDSISKNSQGNYTIRVSPNDNTSLANISISIDGSGVSTMHFVESFNDASIDLVYNPQTPSILSPDFSKWTRGEYAEFLIEAQDHISLSSSGLPDWLDFNETTGLLSGIPTDGNSTEITIAQIIRHTPSPKITPCKFLTQPNLAQDSNYPLRAFYPTKHQLIYQG